jgi:tetratricopeptide (TPR) repeat protein
VSGETRADLIAKAIQRFTSAQGFIRTDTLHFEAGNAWYRSFLQSGDTAALDHAIAQFKQAAQLCPWNPYYPEDIGGLYQNKGDIKDALLYTGQSLKLDPSNASLCMRMADLELENGNQDLAILYYKKACSIYPPYTWDALPRLLASDVAMDKIQQAAAELPDGEWVLANDLISTPRVGLDYTVPIAGELGQGMNQASATANIDTAAGILKGLMLSDTANLKRYIPLFISITPDKRDALAQLEALHITNADMLFYLARLQYETGDNDAAINGLNHIIDTDNTYRDAYPLLANILASQNKLEDAIAVLKKGLYYLPSDFVFYAMLGAFYNQGRDWYNAVESYRMAVLMNPLYENGYVQMALIYREQDRNEQAIDIIKKGLEAVPESAQLKQTLKEIQDSKLKIQD